MSTIPKTIHYCWFGNNPLPDNEQQCIESWKKILPDYKIVRWDETTFDVSQNTYVREAYDHKKYAFVSDYVRLYALVNNGGVYFDTDVEIVKNIDEFMKLEAFSGFENYESVQTGVMAAKKGFHGFADILKYYDGRHFVKSDGTLDTTTNVKIITDFYIERGLIRNNTKQTVDGLTLFPSRVFCPAIEDRKISLDGVYAIHYKNGSWLSEREKKKRKSFIFKVKVLIKYIIKRILGTKKYESIMRYIRKTDSRERMK